MIVMGIKQCLRTGPGQQLFKPCLDNQSPAGVVLTVMIHLRYLAHPILIPLSLLLWSCGDSQEGNEVQKITIIATGNVNGEIEPCG